MTTPATQTAVTETTTRERSKSEFEMLLEKDVKTQVWFEPYGSNDEIKLSVPLIRRYIAVPARDRETRQEIQPSDEQCVKFLMLCKARKLNPFEGDAFMIPFWDKSLNAHNWSLITAHSAFLKRAELHKAYDGMESGVIVQDKDGNVIERKGDFRLDTDKLLGGWAIVFHKDKTHPKISKVRLSTYVKPFGVWMQDPEGMICKVAEAQGLRDSFPTMIGGMFLREEMGTDDNHTTTPEVKRPALVTGVDFAHPGTDKTAAPVEPEKPKRRNRPTMVEAPLDSPTPTVQAEPATTPAVPVASQVPDAAPPTTITVAPVFAEGSPAPEAELVRLAAANGVSQEQLVKFLHAEKFLGRGTPPKTRISELSTKMLGDLATWFKTQPSFVKKAQDCK